MVRGSGSHSGRIGRKEEKNPRGSREGIHKERHQDVRRGHGVTGWLSVIVKVQARILHGNGLGLSEGTTDPVTLKVLSWNVAGLSEESTDTILSQISTLTEWDVLLLQDCSRQLDGVNVGVHEQLTPRRTGGRTAMPSSHHTSAMERTSESCWESEQTDSRAGWTVDHHFGPSASQREKVGEGFQKSFDRNSGFHERLGQHLILCGDFNESFYGLTDCHHVGESIPRPRTLTATNDTMRALASHAVVAEMDLTVTNACGRRLRTGTVHMMQLDGTWRRADTNGPHHGVEETGSKTGASTGLRLVQDGSQGGACFFFGESETEILCETWSDFAWLLTDSKNWAAMAPPACGHCKGAQFDKDQRDDWDRAQARNSSVAEERRTALRANRAQQTLSGNLEKRVSAGKGKTFDQDQGEWRENSQGNTKVNISIRVRVRNKRTPKQFSQTSSKTSIQFLPTKKMPPNPRDSTG